MDVTRVHTVAAMMVALVSAAALYWTAWTGYLADKVAESAAALRAEGQYDEAWALLERELTREPRNAEGWAELGQTYRAAWLFREEPELLERSLATYRRATQTNPAGGFARAELARTLSLAGRHAEADTAYRHALEVDPNNPGLILDRAQALERAGRRADALREYRRAAIVQPNSYSAEAERRLSDSP